MKALSPKRQIIFVFTEVRLLKLHLQKIGERIRIIQNDTSVRNSSVFPIIVTEDKIGCKSNINWLDLDNDLLAELDRLQDLSREENVCVADKIHDAVDSLPFTGNIIDVYIEQSVFNSLRSEHSYQIYGALRRLKDWHNAVITFVKTEGCVESEEVRGIQRLLSASNLQEKDSQLRETAEVIWRGKLSVIDKTINRGFILPGFTISQHNTSCRQTDSETLDNRVFGRMLEMLDEVDISSIPLFYFTGLQLNLSLHDPHPQSTAMLELISDMDSQCGYLCRLACYSEGNDIPSTAEKYLSTSSWKDSIINDITFVQEPEEDFLQPFEFTFFLLTKNPDKDSSLKFSLHVMKSASQINGFLSKMLLMRNILHPHEKTEELINDPLKNLPVFSSEVMSVIKDILNNEQKKLFMQLEGDRDCESVRAALADIQGKILEEVKNGLPLYEGSCDQQSDVATDLEKENTDGCPAELQMDPSEWPEKKYLLYQESQSKSISRLRSTDSLVLSSPIQHQEDTPPIMDIEHCLKLFQPDGNAVSQNLSPVRKRNTSRSRGKLSMRLTPVIVGLQWPDCLDQKAPDIYYNKDKKTEKTEEQCNKICNRYITNDTYSSCSSSVFVVPKKPKKLGKYVEDMLPKTLRRSPRKAVKGPSSGLHSLGVRSSPRKLQNKMMQCQKATRQSPTKKVTKQCSRVQASDTHRRQSLPLLEMKQPLQQTDNDRRKSLTAIQTADSEKGGRRESRSERHKRKLEEIVTDVVLKHGIKHEDPIYKACVQKLFKVTKLFVMDLPNSQNLRTEMKSIAEGQVKQVVDLEKRKQKK